MPPDSPDGATGPDAGSAADPGSNADSRSDPQPRPDVDAGTDVEDVPDAVAGNPFEGEWHWRAGALAGFAAAVVAGVAVSAVRLETLRVAIAGLYGFEGDLAAGWLAHLGHGTLFGLWFAFVLSDPGFHHLSDWWWKTLLAGVVYGVLLAVAGAGIIMPLWLGFVGVPRPETIPHVTPSLLGWHALYGAVLGLAYPFVERRLAGEDASTDGGQS